LDFKFTCESLGGLESAHEVWGVRARFISGVESTFCERGRRCGVQDDRRLTEFGVVGGGVVDDLVCRHSPTCRLVSDHRGK